MQEQHFCQIAGQRERTMAATVPVDVVEPMPESLLGAPVCVQFDYRRPVDDQSAAEFDDVIHFAQLVGHRPINVAND